MARVREGRDYEGEVLYFMDRDNNTVGLLKKKTTWYIMLRAIREKVSHVWSTYRSSYLINLENFCDIKFCFRKNPGGWSSSLNSSHLAKMNKRLDDIQRWLSLSDEDTMVWKMRGKDFQNWLVTKLVSSRPDDIDKLSVRGNFPQLWKLSSLETNSLDHCGDTSGMELKEAVLAKTGNILEDPRGSSPLIEICDDSDTVHIGAFILRDVDLLGKNLKRLTGAQLKTHKKLCDNKKLADISFYDLDKLKSKKFTFRSITDSRPALCSAELNHEDAAVTESSEDILVVIQSNKTDQMLTTVFNALIQQIFHLAIRLNCVEKSVHVEKVKILQKDNIVKCFPESLPEI